MKRTLLSSLLLVLMAITGCQKNWTADHEGHYIGTLSCTNGTSDANASVTLSAVDEVTLRADDGMRFEMTSENRFDIPDQTVGGNPHVGSGFFNGSELTVQFTVSPTGQSSFNCTFTGTR